MKVYVVSFLLVMTTVLAAADLVRGGFNLKDARNGHAVSAANYRGKIQVVFFGFTHCRLTCPIGLSQLADTLGALGPAADQIAPLFITTDPLRDTAVLMRVYAASFSERIIPLHGGPKAVAAAMKRHRVEAEKVEQAPDGSYQMDHPALFFVMDRDGRFIKTLPSSGDPKALARQLRQHL